MLNLKKYKSTFILMGIISLTIASRLGSVLSPSISKIQQTFSHVDPTQVESIASIGDAGSMITAILFGYLLQKITYKTASIIASVLLIIGGILPIFYHNSVFQLLMFALIVGFGAGTVMTIIPSLLAKTYSGKKLSKMFGFIVALEDGFSMLLMLVGGLLAESGWIHNYYVYFISVITLIFSILFIPNTKPNEEKNKVALKNKTDIPMSKINWILVTLLTFLGFIALILGAVLSTKMAVYLTQFNLGGPTTAGTALLFLRAGSIILGLSIGFINKKMSNFTLAFGFLAYGLGATIFILFHNIISVFIGSFIMGIGTSVILSVIPFILSKISSEKYYPMIIGTFSSITSLGFAASTWTFRAIVPFFSSDLIIGTFYGVVIIGISLSIVLMLTNFQTRLKKYYIN